MPGVNTATGPRPTPVRPMLKLPALSTTCKGTHRCPGYSGVKVIEIVQTVPAGLLAPTMQPVIDWIVNSCLPPCDCGIVMLVIVPVAGMVKVMSCGALVVATGIAGRKLVLVAPPLFTTWLSIAEVAVL